MKKLLMVAFLILLPFCSYAQKTVMTGGDQSIDGIKTFVGVVDVEGSLTIDTGSGVFTLERVSNCSTVIADGVLCWNGTTLTVGDGTTAQDIGSGGSGETNTAANAGTLGVGVYEGKIGVDLQFRNIYSPNGKLIVLDAGSGNIGLSVVDSNIVHDALSGFVADEHVAHAGVSITTDMSLTGGGTIAATRTIKLDNDEETPGANKVYGTSAAGAKGWKADPAGGGSGLFAAIGDQTSGPGAFDGTTGSGTVLTFDDTGSADGTIAYDLTNDEFDFNLPINIAQTTAGGSIDFLEGSAGGTNKATIAAPSTFASDRSCTLTDAAAFITASCVQQNAGTDITADLEEETHAAEHLADAADEMFVEALGTACTTGQVMKSDGDGTVSCGTDVGGGNEVRSMYWGAGSMSADGVTATGCSNPAEVTINSGPKLYTVICADNDASTLYGHVVMPDAWDASTVTFEMGYVQTAADTLKLHSDVSAQCRAAAETPSSTWGTEVAMDENSAITGSNAWDVLQSGAVTAAGTCAVGDILFWRWQLDAGGTTTAVATLNMIGMKMEYTTTVGD